MPIIFVGAAVDDDDSVAIPAGHQAGDLLIGFASHNSGTWGSPPSGWTNILGHSVTSFQGGHCSFKIAESDAEADFNPSMSSNPRVGVVVLRGVDPIDPIGASSADGEADFSATNIPYPALTLEKTDGTSWGVRYGGCQTDSYNPAAPSGWTSRADDDPVGVHTLADAVANFTASDIAQLGNGRSIAFSVEVLAAEVADPVEEIAGSLDVEIDLGGALTVPTATVPEIEGQLALAIDVGGSVEAPPATVEEISGLLSLQIGLAGVVEAPAASVAAVEGQLPLEIDLGGDLEVPEVPVASVSASLDIEVDLGGVAEMPTATVTEVSGSLDVEIDLGGSVGVPVIPVESVAANLPVEVGLGGSLETPTATVTEVSGSLDVVVDLLGWIGPLPDHFPVLLQVNQAYRLRAAVAYGHKSILEVGDAEV